LPIPIGIGTAMIGILYAEDVEPFQYDTRTWQTDKWMDRQESLHQCPLIKMLRTTTHNNRLVSWPYYRLRQVSPKSTQASPGKLR